MSGITILWKIEQGKGAGVVEIDAKFNLRVYCKSGKISK